MKKSNKGFVITEVLIISTIIMGILIFVYVQFKNINRNYQRSFVYDTVSGMYAAHDFINYINDGSIDALKSALGNSSDYYVDLTDCDVSLVMNSSYCELLVNKYNVNQVVFAREDLNDLRNSNPLDIEQDMIDYIKYINVMGDSTDYRLIIKFNDNSFASCRFNQGISYANSGMLIHLDAINNNGTGHSSQLEEWVDLSGNSNYASITSSAWYSSEVIMNGSSSYARVNSLSNYDFSSSFTIETLAKIMGVSGDTEFLCNGDLAHGFCLYMDSSYKLGGKAYIGSSLKTLVSSTAFQLDRYYNITFTYDGATLKLYVNGAMVGSSAITGNLVVSSTGLSIGAMINGSNTNEYANVSFKNILLYNRALSDAEVLNNYNTDVNKYGL